MYQQKATSVSLDKTALICFHWGLLAFTTPAETEQPQLCKAFKLFNVGHLGNSQPAVG